MKFLLWAVIAFVLVLWFLHGKKAKLKSDASPSRQRGDTTEAIVQCAVCGVHIPRSEALTSGNGQVFCSDEHRSHSHST